MTSARSGLDRWHAYITGDGHPDELRSLLAADAVFHSPVVHTPQEGRDKVFAYLHAAGSVLGGEGFRYLREIVDGDSAMLEFTNTIDGIHINGVDIIRWNEAGEIVDFKVMVRPLKAMNKIWELMAAQLQANAAA